MVDNRKWREIFGKWEEDPEMEGERGKEGEGEETRVKTCSVHGPTPHEGYNRVP